MVATSRKHIRSIEESGRPPWAGNSNEESLFHVHRYNCMGLA